MQYSLSRDKIGPMGEVLKSSWGFLQMVSWRLTYIQEPLFMVLVILLKS